MPLSDHEQRLLEQMERALSAEDPKFASTLRGADLRAHYRRRAAVAVVVFIVGVVALMTGAISMSGNGGAGGVLLAVGGFVIMLASAWYAVTSWRRIPGPGELSTPAPSATAPRAPSRRPRRGLVERVEERWRRRRGDMGR